MQQRPMQQHQSFFFFQERGISLNRRPLFQIKAACTKALYLHVQTTNQIEVEYPEKGDWALGHSMGRFTCIAFSSGIAFY